MSIKVCKNHLSEKAIKAMYEVIKKGRKHNFSMSCQLDLFDKLVKPILLHLLSISKCHYINKIYEVMFEDCSRTLPLGQYHLHTR
jgi:hypothetical protein